MKYSYWLHSVKGIGNVTKKELIRTLGSAERVYRADWEELKKYECIGEKTINILQENKTSRDAAAEYREFLATGQGFLCMEQAEYPDKLKEIYDAPYALFVLGEFPKGDEKVAAIVGARTCSEYGRKTAYELAAALTEQGYLIVSGLAKGIDAAAHRGCLDAKGKTIAVMGCGADVCYPKQNKALYESIRQNGCILSEYLPKTPPLPMRFPARNRLISAMADIVIVVEAREKSGSLITVERALEQGKDVYAVPGRITDSLSSGCNRLIEQGAGIVTSPDAFAANLREMYFSHLPEQIFAHQDKVALEKDELLVYSGFDFYPKSMEQVLEETGVDYLTLLSGIANLCDKGYLKEIFKNQYIKCK